MFSINIIFLLLCIIFEKFNTENNKFVVASYFGIFDDAYDDTMTINTTIPWNMFDRIYIPFVTIDKYGNLTNIHNIDHHKIKTVITMYRKVRPDGQVFVTTVYGWDMDDRYVYAANHPLKFSLSALKYFEKYNIDGVDLDWETFEINYYSKELVTLIKTCKTVFGNKYKITHTIWPYTHSPETVGLLANIVDEVNIMSYSIDIMNLEFLINQYHKCGFPYQKMILGIETESGTETKDIINGKINLVNKYNLSGVYVWRLDNDDRPIINNTASGPSTFKTTKILYNILQYNK